MQTKPHVLLIYTGGTIGMIHDVETGVLKAFDFNHLSKQIPELDRLHVQLSTHSFDDPIDSSEINPHFWSVIASLVYENYAQYDGFVILHGSDTMAYTASALSFMLQGLRKPVILTGSQLPIGTIRTDGKENLITAIEIAAAKKTDGTARIQEVAIYFEYSLYRGNRTSKISANNFEAFASPNYPELAVAGVDIRFSSDLHITQEAEKISLFTDFNTQVVLLKIFPGFNPACYESLFQFPHVRGIVLETFGSGNAPSTPAFYALIQQFIAAGGVVLNITQCSTGSVSQGKYATSSLLQESGVIGGGDLTTEAAITKMMYLLGKWNDKTQVERALTSSLVGEMSTEMQ